MSGANGISRRELLKSGAVGGAALLVGFHLPWVFAQDQQQMPAPNPFNAWVKIDKDSNVTLIAPLPELGEGLTTSLPMILAEELDADWSKVHIERAAFHPEWYGGQDVGGSGGVSGAWIPVRQAGAAARLMLINAAARVWNVAPDDCFAHQSAVYHGVRKKHLTYGELVEAASQLPVPNLHTVPLKSPSEFTLVGKAMPRTDLAEKADGSAIFGMDVRVPGMVYAVIARCPTFGGKVAKLDSTKAQAVPGVRKIFEVPAIADGAHTAGGIAVVADTTWAAIKGREALDIEWDRGAAAAENSAALHEQFVALAAKPGKTVRNDGHADSALASAAKKIDAVYEMPFLAHATMEPMNCTVQLRADGADVWVPTQAPSWNREVIANIAKLKPETVKVHPTLAGGGFGRRYQADFAAEAAQVAVGVGAPVKLVWTREDDMQHDFYRPAHYQTISGGLDDKGNITAWKHRIVSTSISAFWDPPDKAKPENQEVGGATEMPYTAANLRVEYANPPSHVPVAWWRSVEHSVNGFTVESFIDELAHAAGEDPMKFRLRLLDPQRKIKNLMFPDDVPLDTARLKPVLQLAAEKSGWGKPLPAGQGRGIAAHYSFDTYVAHVAEVTVAKNGNVKVDRVICAVDCGRAVNPDGVKAQMESGIIYALSAALMGEITIENGAVKQANFDTYPVLRMREAPAIEVYIVPSEADPTGCGEPGVPPTAPAVTNGIFAATGTRIRRLPIRPEDLRSA